MMAEHILNHGIVFHWHPVVEGGMTVFILEEIMIKNTKTNRYYLWVVWVNLIYEIDIVTEI